TMERRSCPKDDRSSPRSVQEETTSKRRDVGASQSSPRIRHVDLPPNILIVQYPPTMVTPIPAPPVQKQPKMERAAAHPPSRLAEEEDDLGARDNVHNHSESQEEEENEDLVDDVKREWED